MERPRFDCYQCEEDGCNVSDEELSSCKDAIFCWKSTTLIRVNGTRERKARGCIFNERHSRLFCKNSLQRINTRTECCSKKFCNGGAFPSLLDARNDPGTALASLDPYLLLAILVPMLLVIVAACSIVIYCRRRVDFFCRIQREQHELMRMRPRPRGTPTNEAHEDKGTNLSKKITLLEKWTTGSFGQNPPELWRGKYRGKKVMIKIYSLNSKETWAYEVSVYTKLLTTKHDNVLEYVISEMTTGSVDNSEQFWLVTRCHRNGPLVNYLRETKLDKNTMLKACWSLTSGLSYVHEEISTKCKLAMAHRNLGSNNVFVKHDGSCVIGGFECSTASIQDWVNRDSLFIELAAKRYMSPEYISLDIEEHVWTLDRFQQADVYSLSLIFWEICCMYTESKKIPTQYAAAYSEWLGADSEEEPTLQEMHDIIIAGRRRPKIPNHWRTDRVMRDMGTIIQTCWDTDTEKRLSSDDIKKDLAKLAEI